MTVQRSVLIIGCSDGGIGSSLAAAFHTQGFRVFATARNLAKVTQLPKDSNITLIHLDITKAEDVRTAVDVVSRSTAGTLDYLVNNAARNHFMPILDEDLTVGAQLFKNNTLGPIAVTQAFAPLVIKGKGSMIFVTSCGGYTNVPYMGTYNASKRALEIMAETLRLEMQPFGVRVLCVVVGVVQTMGQTYFDDLSHPKNSIYKPVEQKFLGMARGTWNPFPKMAASDFASSAMRDILGGTSGRAWHGSAVGFMKFLSGWAPQSLAGSLFCMPP